MPTWDAFAPKTWDQAFPDKWRVGVIGAGPRALAMVGIWRERADVEAIGMVDPVFDTLGPVVKKLGVTGFSDVVTLLSQHPHIIINATRSPLHYPLSLLALDAPRDLRALIVEKPLADTPAHAERLVALAKDRGVELAVCHQISCTPPVAYALEMLKHGDIGPLRRIEITGKGYFAGYEMFNLAPHYLNVATLFTGAVTGVTASAVDPQVVQLPYAFGRSLGSSIEAAFQTVSAVPIHLALTQRDKPNAEHMAVDLVGDKGSLRLYWRWWLHFHPGAYQHSGVIWERVEIPQEVRTLNGHDYASRQGGDDWLAEETMQRLKGAYTTEHPASGARALNVTAALYGALVSAHQGSAVTIDGQYEAYAAPKAELDPRLSILRYREWVTRRAWMA